MTYDEAKVHALKLRTLRCPGCKLPILLNGYQDAYCPKGCGTFRFYPVGMVDAKTGEDAPNQWVFYYRGRFSFQARQAGVRRLV